MFQSRIVEQSWRYWSAALLGLLVLGDAAGQSLGISGHVKGRLALSEDGNRSLYAPYVEDPLVDGSLELRLKRRWRLNDALSFEVHYEALWLGGDTREAQNELRQLADPSFPAEVNLLFRSAGGGQSTSESRRLFGLSGTLAEDGRSLSYHRVDRLNLIWSAEWGTVSLGRQAVTWGNGFLFHPFDLFNPFAPSEIDRDYKVGDDMVRVEIPFGFSSDLQVLVVPRRSADTGAVGVDSSSLALKYRFNHDEMTVDVLGAWHYQDLVAGLGLSGYLGQSVWRFDLTWTKAVGDLKGEAYVTAVANLDYSWVWGGRNFYGYLEWFYSGVGLREWDYVNLVDRQQLLARLERGDLYGLGQDYGGGLVQCELHPLVNAYVSLIASLQDSSGVVQPYVSYDIRQDCRITAGASIRYGATGSEFGGIVVDPDAGDHLPAPTSGFVWVTWFF